MAGVSGTIQRESAAASAAAAQQERAAKLAAAAAEPEPEPQADDDDELDDDRTILDICMDFEDAAEADAGDDADEETNAALLALVKEAGVLLRKTEEEEDREMFVNEDGLQHTLKAIERHMDDPAWATAGWVCVQWTCVHQPPHRKLVAEEGGLELLAMTWAKYEADVSARLQKSREPFREIACEVWKFAERLLVITGPDAQRAAQLRQPALRQGRTARPLTQPAVACAFEVFFLRDCSRVYLQQQDHAERHGRQRVHHGGAGDVRRG